MSSSVTSDGIRYTTKQRDLLVRKAKYQKLDQQKQDKGYNKCEICNSNGHNTYLDCSHTVSIKKACETGRTELCWSVYNIRVLCRDCHRIHDKSF